MSGVTAIVLAAGNGSRMNSEKKKQFMEIKGKPVLWYSLFAFERSDVEQIVLVTAKDDIEYCRKEIIEKYGFVKVNAIVEGGKERYESVYNGLKAVEGEIVLIHDGARPVINNSIIQRCIEGAKYHIACVAGVPVKDTIKIVGNNNIIEETPDRNKIWITQTPQAFKTTMIKNAYEQLYTYLENEKNEIICSNIKSDDGKKKYITDSMKKTTTDKEMDEELQTITDKELGKKQKKNLNITDDAMVVEQFTGNKVRFVEGDYKNIKITTPEDILLAEMFLK